MLKYFNEFFNILDNFFVKNKLIKKKEPNRNIILKVLKIIIFRKRT